MALQKLTTDAPDFSRYSWFFPTTMQFPDFSRFSRSVVTLK